MIFQCDNCGRQAMYNVIYEDKSGTVYHEQLCAHCAAFAGNSAKSVHEYKLLFKYRG